MLQEQYTGTIILLCLPHYIPLYIVYIQVVYSISNIFIWAMMVAFFFTAKQIFLIVVLFQTDIVALYKNTVSSMMLDCTIKNFYMKKERFLQCN